MILSITFSRPAKNVRELLGDEYVKIRLFRLPAASALSGTAAFSAEFFTKTQVFQKKMTESQVQEFYEKNAGTAFKNVICTTDEQEITTLANRHGEIKTLTKKRKAASMQLKNTSSNRTKNYILREGTPVPFLIHLGVTTREGKVISSRYDKFRQINRFLEFVDDILDDLTALCTDGKGFTQERPLSVLDFGSGKSYLTFAVHYYLTQIKNIPVSITGIDLKKDVIQDCQNFAEAQGYSDINFVCGDVALFNSRNADLMITLHACDMATDYALNHAVRSNTAAILSVPCCQHEINAQLAKDCDAQGASVFMHHGILKERFAALATDALRAELLEQNGYNVQLLEFIDEQGTPKNLLIRALLRKSPPSPQKIQDSRKRLQALLSELNVSQKLLSLLSGNKI